MSQRVHGSQMPVPAFWDTKKFYDWSYNVDYEEIGALAHVDRVTFGFHEQIDEQGDVILVVSIDCQCDFCIKGKENAPIDERGSLYVDGAEEALIRTSKFLLDYRHLPMRFLLSKDTHSGASLHNTRLWIAQNGLEVPGYTPIPLEDIESGKYRVNLTYLPLVARGRTVKWLEDYVRFYAWTLRQNGNQTLIAWPDHCFVGSQGQEIVGAYNEVVRYLAGLRGEEPRTLTKGMNPLTEHYSIYEPEVLRDHEGKLLRFAYRDEINMRRTLKYKAILFNGFAGSHCVRATLRSYIRFLLANDPTMFDRVYVVKDWIVPVVAKLPDGTVLADFTADQEQILAECAGHGMHVVESSTPMENWPGPISAIARAAA